MTPVVKKLVCNGVTLAATQSSNIININSSCYVKRDSAEQLIYKIISKNKMIPKRSLTSLKCHLENGL